MFPALLFTAATAFTAAPPAPINALLDGMDATPLEDRPRSAKLQAALKARAAAVGVARPKIEALLAEARSNGVASGPIAAWIKTTFKQEAKVTFLMIVNGQLTVGLVEPKTWVEPPAARPACNVAGFSAVANEGQDTIWLCDKFYKDDVDEGALTLFHEAQHLRGMRDCEGGISTNIPLEKRVCAQNFEDLLRYLWKGK